MSKLSTTLCQGILDIIFAAAAKIVIRSARYRRGRGIATATNTIATVVVIVPIGSIHPIHPLEKLAILLLAGHGAFVELPATVSFGSRREQKAGQVVAGTARRWRVPVVPGPVMVVGEIRVGNTRSRSTRSNANVVVVVAMVVVVVVVAVMVGDIGVAGVTGRIVHVVDIGCRFRGKVRTIPSVVDFIFLHGIVSGVEPRSIQSG